MKKLFVTKKDIINTLNDRLKQARRIYSVKIFLFGFFVGLICGIVVL